MNDLFGECSFNRPDEVYHVSVMPCYDKKLEAARDDFVFEVDSPGGVHENTGLRITEVDSVLTSGEVLELIQVTVRFCILINFIDALIVIIILILLFL